MHANIAKNWLALTKFEQKVYLLDFCLTVNEDLKNMKGIKDVDLVKLYANSNEKMEDMLSQKSKCIVM